jgi:sialidase-1
MDKSRLPTITLVTLTLLFGLHGFRLFLYSLTSYLIQSLAPEQLALYALLVFASALLTPLARRLLGDRVLLIATAGGLALLRLTMQIIDAPAAYLVLSTAGVILWGWFIPYWQQSKRNRANQDAVPILVIALPLAFVLDTAARTLLWSDDLVWQKGLGAMLLVAGLVTLALFLLWRELKGEQIADPAEEPSLGKALPFLGLGPFIYLILFVLGEPGLTGLGDMVTAHLFINLFAVLGGLACLLAATWPRRRTWPAALLDGLLLAAALILLIERIGPGWLWLGLAALTAWPAAGWLLTDTAGREPRLSGLWRNATATFLGLLLLLILVFLEEELTILWAIPAAGLILGLTATWAAAGGGWRAKQPAPAELRYTGALALVALLLVGLWAWWSGPAEVDGAPLTAVFVNGEDGYACYRIPGIVRAGDGALLAIAEGRVDNCGDHGGPIRVVAKRSADNGRSWGPLMLVGDNILPDGTEHVAQNPSPLVDLMDPANPQGKIIVIFNKTEYGEVDIAAGRGVRRVYATESLDHGQSWSEPLDITGQVHKPNNPEYTAVYADAAERYDNPEDWRKQIPATGHAIQLRGAEGVPTGGRLYVAGSVTIGESDIFHAQNYAFWSDDHGASWQIGGLNPQQGDNEAMAVELADGRVMVNARNYDDGEPVGLRSVTVNSFDEEGRISFGQRVDDVDLQSPTVQASIQRFTWPDEPGVDGRDRILFSIPDHPRLRQNMTVRLSYDEGQSWPVAKTVDPGPSAYSDLVIQDDDHIGLLYERGNDGGIYYTSFSLDWLSDGEDALE